MKIIISFIICFGIIFSNYTSLGRTPEEAGFHDIGFSVGTINADTGSTGLEELGSQSITIVTTIGSVVSIIVLIILGIKYMIGSVEEKAEYKKTMMAYVIGAAFVFAASTIASVIYNIAINLK